MKLEQSSVLSSLETFSDSDSLSDERSYSLSGASSVAASPRKRSHDQLEENTSVACLDLKELQRKRRQKRVEVMRMKRQRRRGSFGSSSCSASDDETLMSSSSSPVHEIIDLTQVTNDPQLLRKLRNRGSAVRSRQKIIDLIDNLTFQLMERYVMLKDLQDQLAFLDNKQKECSNQGFVLAHSQYPSQQMTMPMMMEVSPHWHVMNTPNTSPSSSYRCSPTFEMQLQDREFHQFLQASTNPQDVNALLNGLFADNTLIANYSNNCSNVFDDVDYLYREMLFV